MFTVILGTSGEDFILNPSGHGLVSPVSETFP